jgi:hypothetical protein
VELCSSSYRTTLCIHRAVAGFHGVFFAELENDFLHIQRQSALTCVVFIGKRGKGSKCCTYRQSLRIRAILNQRDAIGELLAIEARVLLLLAMLCLYCGAT